MRFRDLPLSCCLFAAFTLALAMPSAAQHGPKPAGPRVDHPPNPCSALGLEAGGEGDDDDLPNICTLVLRQTRKFTHEDAEHLRVILRFTKDKPQLRAHLLTLLSPPQGDNVQPTGDGNFSVTVPLNTPCIPSDFGDNCLPQPTQETVSTSGLSMKLSGIFRSVVFATDRRAQLALYTEAYNRLPEGFTVGDTVLPTPSSLSHGNLTTIGNALTLIGNSWRSIIGNLPPPNTPPDTSDCDGEVGTTPQHPNYGDRTGNSSSCTPSSSGLFSSLPDTNFPARKYLTCHSFASTSAVEMMISQTHGVKTNLSEQDLMEHYRTLWSPGYEHESGDAYEELSGAINNNYFFAYENRWDYNPSYGRTFNANTGVYVNSCTYFPNTEPGCSESAPQAPGFCFGFALFVPGIGPFPFPICSLHDAGVPESPYQPTSLTSFWNSNNTELSKEYMILNIAFNNAVILGFNVTDRFENGGNGGYVVWDATDVTTNKGGHYVHVVGLATNDELPEGAPQAVGGGYFIVKNSWNNCFGDAGYLYLDWDYVKAVGWQGFSVSSVN
jgi:hypothetical protein